MINTPDPVENLQQLYDDVKKYIQLQSEYVKVEFVEKLTVLISALLIIFLVIILIMGALFYLFFSVAYLIEPIVGSMTASFFIISTFYLLLTLFLFVFRKKVIINPLVRFLSRLFLNK